MRYTNLRMVVLIGKKLTTKVTLETDLFIILTLPLIHKMKISVFSVFTYVNVSQDGGKNFQSINACLWCG